MSVWLIINILSQQTPNSQLFQSQIIAIPLVIGQKVPDSRRTIDCGTSEGLVSIHTLIYIRESRGMVVALADHGKNMSVLVVKCCIHVQKRQPTSCTSPIEMANLKKNREPKQNIPNTGPTTTLKHLIHWVCNRAQQRFPIFLQKYNNTV